MTGTAGSEAGEPGLLWLDLTRIKPYDHDPRRAPNPEHERIKDSIRSEGLVQPLVVTQRPGEESFMVGAGGNTRLRILRELFEETAEARFARVPCVLRAWAGELDVLLAHLKENDLRGALTFIEKAQGVVEAQRMLAGELGPVELSQRRLVALLEARGYSLSQGLVSQMQYAVERLLPVLPQALAAGMGRPQVEKIRGLDRAARVIWEAHGAGGAQEYEAVFAALCQRHDGPDWDLGSLRRSIEAEIAERSEVSIHAVSLALAARLAGHTPASVRHTPEEATRDAPTSQAAKATNGPTRRGDSRRTPSSACGQPDGWGEPGAEAEAGEATPPAEDEVPQAIPGTDDAPVRAPDPTHARAATGASGLTDLKSLRARAWTLAARLAQRHGLGDLVQLVAGNGLGYVLRDVPEPALLEQLDEDDLARVSLLWWQLAACADMTVGPAEDLLPLLDSESVLRRATAQQDAELLFTSVWTPDPGQMGYRLWRRLDGQAWQDLLALMDTYRVLHASVARTGAPLWRSRQ